MSKKIINQIDINRYFQPSSAIRDNVAWAAYPNDGYRNDIADLNVY